MSFPQGDPADQFLAATAKVFALTLVTADEHLIVCQEFTGCRIVEPNVP
jgi:PIN domain nuclease of toxin-antitoxin system